jgi:hypothetical protein
MATTATVTIDVGEVIREHVTEPHRCVGRSMGSSVVLAVNPRTDKLITDNTCETDVRVRFGALVGDAQ